MKKVALIGPESTGKTTLCKQLAQHFKTEWVPEYARTYIEILNREYKYHDVENIARMQQLQFYLHERKDGLVFFDTDLIITKIWFSERYNNVPKWLNKALKKQNIQLYLLCKPDLEWEYDTVRENANNRQYLYNRYKKEVEKLSIPFFEISGLGEIRIKNAIEAVKSSFNYG